MKKRTLKYYAIEELTQYIVFLFVFHTVVHIFGLYFILVSPKSAFLVIKRFPLLNLNILDLLVIISCLILIFVLTQLRLVRQYKTKHVTFAFIVLILCSLSNLGYVCNLKRISWQVKDHAINYLEQAQDDLKNHNYHNEYQKSRILQTIEEYKRILGR